MALPNRKRRGLKRKKDILLVCEGEETEVIYFESLKQILGLPNVSIKVNGAGKSGTKLLDYASGKVKLSKGKYDSVWVIFDKDDLNRMEIEKTAKLAIKRGINIGFTNLCFEIWLLLHFEPLDYGQEVVKEQLDKKLSTYLEIPRYNKKKSSVEVIRSIAEEWEKAKINSEKLYTVQSDKFKNPYSDIHLLIKDLLSNK